MWRYGMERMFKPILIGVMGIIFLLSILGPVFGMEILSGVVGIATIAVIAVPAVLGSFILLKRSNRGTKKPNPHINKELIEKIERLEKLEELESRPDRDKQIPD
jgi:hypothetical protein